MPKTFDSSRRKRNEQNNGSASSLSTLATILSLNRLSICLIMLQSRNIHVVAKWQELLDNQTIPGHVYWGFRQSTLGGNHGMTFVLTWTRSLRSKVFSSWFIIQNTQPKPHHGHSLVHAAKWQNTKFANVSMITQTPNLHQEWRLWQSKKTDGQSNMDQLASTNPVKRRCHYPQGKKIFVHSKSTSVSTRRIICFTYQKMDL
jgi:hypothetical protein